MLKSMTEQKSLIFLVKNWSGQGMACYICHANLLTYHRTMTYLGYSIIAITTVVTTNRLFIVIMNCRQTEKNRLCALTHLTFEEKKKTTAAQMETAQ